MPDQAFTELIVFTRCQNWNTDTCPQLKNPQMQLSIINEPHWYLLNDQTVEGLNGMCDQCEHRRKK
jgi:hypothetical protein